MTRLAAALLLLAWFAFASAALVIRWLHADPRLAGALSYQAIMLAFATMGAVLVAARPRNPIGWLLCAVAVLDAQFRLGGAIAADLPQLISASMPVAVAVALSGPLQLLVYGLIALILLLFPDGRFLSPRWRAAALGPLGLVAGAALAGLLAAGPIHLEAAEVAKPFGVEALVPLATILQAVAFLAIVLGLGIAAASLLRRYRSGGSVQRQQVKWVAASASLIALFWLTLLGLLLFRGFLRAISGVSSVGVLDVSPILAVWNFVSYLSLPLAIAFAIFRYRLYDIDILINRALVYGALTSALAATYFGAVALLQSALRPLSGESELAVAGSTLLVVALAAPLRRRIQGTVDRRFYRSRYDAARTLDAFGARLRDDVDLDSVRADLLDVVHDTIRPAHASVWLRKQARQ